MSIGFTLIYICILILSIVLHEVAHGYAAYSLGDPTAKLQGRLTLNPIKHLDPVGSLLVPGLLILAQSPFLIGWAKPVPFNPYNFKKMRKWGSAYVAIAGPITNVLIAFAAIGIAKIFSLTLQNPAFALEILSMTALLNIALALFNLIPVPPLDGHHILFTILPPEWDGFKEVLQRWSLPILIFVMIVVWPVMSPWIMSLYESIWSIFF